MPWVWENYATDTEVQIHQERHKSPKTPLSTSRLFGGSESKYGVAPRSIVGAERHFSSSHNHPIFHLRGSASIRTLKSRNKGRLLNPLHHVVVHYWNASLSGPSTRQRLAFGSWTSWISFYIWLYQGQNKQSLKEVIVQENLRDYFVLNIVAVFDSYPVSTDFEFLGFKSWSNAAFVTASFGLLGSHFRFSEFNWNFELKVISLFERTLGAVVEVILVVMRIITNPPEPQKSRHPTHSPA